LYGVYHDLLGFLPGNAEDKVTFRVTQNVITSEVAGMVLNGMFGTEADYPLLIQVRLRPRVLQALAKGASGKWYRLS
jgi:acid phosphatase